MSPNPGVQHLDHFVYRAYDGWGDLLYVGCSFNVAKRTNEHRKDGWRKRMWRLEVDGPYSYPVARSIERELIRTADPRHNGDTPRALADKRKRNTFIDSVMRTAIANGEDVDTAVTQAVVAASFEFPEWEQHYLEVVA